MSKQNFGKKTKMLAGLSVLLLLSGSFLLGVSANQNPQNRITVNEIKDQTLANKFSTVHFNVGGNDFGGGFFWKESKNLSSPQAITANGEKLLCYSQIRGYYYNSQRGERLWPLDDESKLDLQTIHNEYREMHINGGLFTNCQKVNTKNEELKDERVNSQTAIYGRITHAYKGKDFFLYAGLKNNIIQNQLPEASLRCNLQRIDNQYPFGYIYDKAGGVGMVGAYVKSQDLDKVKEFNILFTQKLSQDKCVNDFYILEETAQDTNKTSPKTYDQNLGPKDNDLIFGEGNAIETMMNLGIRGIVGLSSQVQTLDKKGIEGNQKKTSLLVSTTENIGNIINLANKKAEMICRNKWGNLIKNSEIICSNNGGTINPNDYAGKTLIIKNGNLILKNYMDTSSDATTIFLMKGNLILTDTDNTKDFQANGYPASNGIMKANYLKGNFIINGLIQANEENGIKNKLVVHGKIASFNTLNDPSKQAKEKISKIIDVENKKIGLSEIFSWKCNIKTGKGTDGYNCGQKTDQTARTFLIDKSFGLIDMYFPSKLFK